MSFLSNLNWDGISKTIGAVGTAADKISQTAIILGQKNSSVSNETRTSVTQGNSGGILAAAALVAGILLLKR